MSFLQTIVDAKRREVEMLKKNPLKVMPKKPCRHVFCRAIDDGSHVSLIAEIKKASPSAGVICENLDPAGLAKTYTKAGASAISVVTDQDFFQGSLDYLKAARKVTDLPILRKDFIIDASQIHESAEVGADAILLIAAVLTEQELREFRELAESLDMDALVEVHDEEELDKALKSGALMIGVNNRDLKTFEVDLNTTFCLAKKLPEDAVLVAESGISTRLDMGRLRSVSHAALVGTSILKSDDVEAKVQELSIKRPLLKVCGIQDAEMAHFCEEQGVEFLGLNFISESPRYIDSESAKAIIGSVSKVKTVGLFMDENLETVNQVARDLNLDYVQIHGDATPEYCEQIELPVIKSFTNTSKIAPYADVIEFPLLDVKKGSDEVILVSEEPSIPYFLAGGLTPENVAQVICDLKPFAVDVARGVEANGQKDKEKIIQFINQL